MVLFNEMFISELLGVPVVDHIQEEVGEVRDIITVIGEAFPKITGLLVRVKKNGRDSVILMTEINLIGKQFVSTKSIRERIVYTTLREGEVLLKRDILDKQIVDTAGARVVRVNDLKLAKMGEDIRLIAADVGLRGLLRRTGIERMVYTLLNLFRIKLPDTLIGWNYVELLKTELAKGRIMVPHKRVVELHPADIATIISQVHAEEKTEIFKELSEKTAAEALHELEPMIGAMLLSTVDTKRALNILEKMPVDEIADLLGDLPEEKTEELLRLMKVKKANQVRSLLKHPEETAGGLMTTEFISLPHTFSAQDTINKLRELAPDAETIYYLYIVNEQGKLVGVLSLRALIVILPETPISDIMVKEVISVEPGTSQKDVADIISKYNLLAVPVVNEGKKIVGIVTVDDVVDFIIPPVSRRKRHMLG